MVIVRRVLIICIAVIPWLLPGSIQARTGQFKVYLGFDDGPRIGRTDLILDVLKKYNVKATFFVQGIYIADGKDIVRREIQEGHHIGSHLWTHERQILQQNRPRMNLLLDYYQYTQVALESALGDELWLEYNAREPIKPFRWPGGALYPFPRTDVITYNWQVSAGDDTPVDISASQEVENVLYGEPARHIYGVYAWGDEVVILLHDTRFSTVQALPAIIEHLKAHGAIFETLPRQGDVPGTMPIRIGQLPHCARQPDNCTTRNDQMRYNR